MIDDKTYKDLMEDGALHLYDKTGENFIGTIGEWFAINGSPLY